MKGIDGQVKEFFGRVYTLMNNFWEHKIMIRIIIN